MLGGGVIPENYFRDERVLHSGVNDAPASVPGLVCVHHQDIFPSLSRALKLPGSEEFPVIKFSVGRWGCCAGGTRRGGGEDV